MVTNLGNPRIHAPRQGKFITLNKVPMHLTSRSPGVLHATTLQGTPLLLEQGGKVDCPESLGPIKPAINIPHKSSPNSALLRFKLIKVPKVSNCTYEDRESLTNKTIHWLRGQYKCNSIIRNDIIGTHRLNSREGDTIEVMVGSRVIVGGLRAIDARDT